MLCGPALAFFSEEKCTTSRVLAKQRVLDAKKITDPTIRRVLVVNFYEGTFT